MAIPPRQRRAIRLMIGLGRLWPSATSVFLCMSPVYTSLKTDRPGLKAVMQAARTVRWEQYRQAVDCRQALGPSNDCEPMLIAELRTHTQDALHAHHDWGHGSLVCFIPEILKKVNICVVILSPSCRFATHVVQSAQPSEGWIFLVAYQEHMRLAIAPDRTALDTLARCRQAIAQPVGWKALLDFGPFEVPISTKSLGKCPHCQQNNVRLPLGIEGAIIGRDALYTDVQLREYGHEGDGTRVTPRPLGLYRTGVGT